MTTYQHQSKSSSVHKSRFRIVKGSDWSKIKTLIREFDSDGNFDEADDIYEENERTELIRRANGIFVNDAFIPLWNVTKGILLLAGGYGSSKTTYAITRLLVKCQENKYFRCFYGREKKTEARELHKNIITEIKRNFWEDLFDYSEQPNGSPMIRCKANGNSFELFGCDDIASLKGLNQPTDILVDEINQISFASFGMLLSRLRTPGCDLQMWGCFNNCDVFPDHWLVKYIYSDEISSTGSKEEERIIKALKKKKTVKHHSVYTDNWFMNHEAYKASLEIQAGGDDAKIQAYLNGSWGVSLSAQPYYKQFNKNVHVTNPEYDSSLPLRIIFDENVNPYFPCLIAQISGNETRLIDEIAARSPNNTLIWVCEEIKRRYPDHNAGMYIYGDASSKKEDVKQEKGKNLFTLAAEYLSCYNPQIRVSTQNPNNSMRQNFLNMIFLRNYGNLSIHLNSSCTHMIEDLVHCQEDPNPARAGSKDKSRVTVNGVKGVQRFGHFGDCLDYLMCEAFRVVYSMFQHGSKTHKPKGGIRQVKNTIEEPPRLSKTKELKKIDEKNFKMIRKSRNVME